jgi:tetratricopeptide (TPR) repeat protein
MKAVARELERRFAQATSAGECLAALLDIAQAHAAAFQNREGLRAAREALNIARVRGDSVAIGRALGTATLCHYQRGDYVSAVASGLDAVEAYADGDLPGRSQAFQSIALALLSVQAYEPAEAVATRAVADAQHSGDAQREAGARSVHGVILADRGRFNAARRELRAAAAIHRLLRQPAHLKKSISNLGHTYRKQADAEERAGRAQSRFYLKQALRVYRVALDAGRSDADDAIILGAIAECHCRMGNLEQAAAEIARALALAREVASPVILAPCELWESHILRAMGDLDAAAKACERAVLTAAELEHDDILVTALQAHSAIEDLRGRFEHATDLEKRARQLSLERETLLARVREEMGPLWERYTAERRTGPARDAA